MDQEENNLDETWRTMADRNAVEMKSVQASCRNKDDCQMDCQDNHIEQAVEEFEDWCLVDHSDTWMEEEMNVSRVNLDLAWNTVNYNQLDRMKQMRLRRLDCLAKPNLFREVVVVVEDWNWRNLNEVLLMMKMI